MNELHQTLEGAFRLAPEGNTKALLGRALDMLDTISMEPFELREKVRSLENLLLVVGDALSLQSAKVKRVKAIVDYVLKHPDIVPMADDYALGYKRGLGKARDLLAKEFPDAD